MSTKKSFVWGTIFFFCFAILMTVISFEVMFDLDEDFVELENASGVKKGDFVSLEVTNVLDKYFITTNYVTFIKTSVEEHYMVILENDEVVPLVVSNKKMRKKLDDLRNRVQDGETVTEPIIVKGLVNTFDPDVKRVYEQRLEGHGISEDTNRIYWVEVDGTVTIYKVWGMVLLFASFGVLCVWALVKTIKKEKNTPSAAKENMTAEDYQKSFDTFPSYEEMETPRYSSASVNRQDDVFTRAENQVKERRL